MNNPQWFEWNNLRQAADLLSQCGKLTHRRMAARELVMKAMAELEADAAEQQKRKEEVNG